MKLTLRIWILIFVLLLSILAILPWPPSNLLGKGVVIKSIEQNSSAFEAGLRQGMVIEEINSKTIGTLEDYGNAMSEIFAEQKNLTKLTIRTSDNQFIFLTNKTPELTLGTLPKTKIKTGLDLSGGARALVKPVNVSVSSADIDDLIAITNERFNIYGISDISLRAVKDLEGNNYMLVEVAGASPADLNELVSKQGKFEAKIGNETVFIGGKRDIASVCRNDATCAGIESCFAVQGGEACRFRFVIYLSEEAAKKHADITSNLGINITEQGRYLEKKLDLYLDDNLVDSLLISEDLKGRVTTQIQIQGSGSGATRLDAINDAKQSMQKLQTILITGSLPYKLEIVKLDTISPTLGKEFTRNMIILGLVVFLIISVILFIRYRKIKITGAVILTMFSEAFITLAIAALIKWNLDAPSIAGLIAGMGTGVNDQIVIIDESISNLNISLKERIKRAFFIILGAFFTIIAAMLPLFWAGAGLLRGFALTTILTVCIGILITRPAFADILKKIQQ